jgi:hypothetical protein
VFEINKTGQETVLHSFDLNDGESPIAAVVEDEKGNHYGTTYAGGTGKCKDYCGVVFKLTP